MIYCSLRAQAVAPERTLMAALRVGMPLLPSLALLHLAMRHAMGMIGTTPLAAAVQRRLPAERRFLAM